MAARLERVKVMCQIFAQNHVGMSQSHCQKEKRVQILEVSSAMLKRFWSLYTVQMYHDIHKSNECFLYLTLCWQSHKNISTGYLILAINTRIVHQRRCIVCYFYASSKWMDVNPRSRNTTVLLSGTSQWWRGRISV